MKVNKLRCIKQLAVVVLFLAITLLVTGCYHLSMVPYYHDKSNYQNYTGILTDVFYHEKDGKMALYLIIDDPYPSLADRTFALEGDNLTIAVGNGVESINTGSEIQFVTAPKYYGDGYVMPVVGLKTSETTYLETETGVENWICFLDEQ